MISSTKQTLNEDWNMQDEKIRNVYISTNVSCNLRCIYCYEDKSGKETFDVENTKKKLLQILSTKTGGSTIVNFHGGEPFLVFDKLKELCEWIWKQNIPEPFVFFATTNGTKVHGEIQQWLEQNKNRFVAGLSLDGNREMQNINRSNSFDDIDIDFFVKTWPNQGIKMTVSPLTIDMLADGIKFLHSVGIPDILVTLAYMVNWSEPRFVKTYYQELKKLAVFYKDNPQLKRDSIFDLPFSILLSEEVKTRRRCGAGIEVDAYDIDGEKYPCHLFFKSVCGKEKSEGWHNIDFSDPNVYISKKCSMCQLYPLCPTCYGANYIERGSIGERDMSLCLLEKVRALVVAEFEYDRIINSKEDYSSLSINELENRLYTLDALKKLEPFLLKIKEEIGPFL